MKKFRALLENESIISKEAVRLYQDDTYSLKKLYSIETKIKDALAKKVWLNSGANIVIEPTEALTTIDVNTGKFV